MPPPLLQNEARVYGHARQRGGARASRRYAADAQRVRAAASRRQFDAAALERQHPPSKRRAAQRRV
jgi:hypothetical protein